MTVPTGRLQFFTLEASDYLERLASIAGASTAPNSEDFVRLTRALRGTALMAGLSAFSQAASGIEQIAKAQRDGQWAWTPANTELLAGGIEELKRLVRRATEWDDADSAAAVRLGARLIEGLTRGPPVDATPPTPAPADGGLRLSPNVRAFIAREGALVAGSLEHAAQAIALGPIDQASELVLRRLQPLRGLGAIPELVPLPDFLDAIELTLRAFHEQAAPPQGADALRRVAAAVSALSRDVAESRELNPEAEPLRSAAESLLLSFGSEADVVPIASLFAADDQAPVVRAGVIATEPSPSDNPTIAFVGLADRLRQAAEQLEAASSETGRLLCLYGVLLDLRPIGQSIERGTPSLGPALSAIERAIVGRRASRAPSDFGNALREAARIIANAAESRNAVFLEEELSAIAHRLDRLDQGEPPGPTATPADDEVVPIEQLLATEPELEPAPVQALSHFEQSFSTLHRLVHSAPPTTAPEPTPQVEAPSVAEPEALPDQDVVPIGHLLYRGRRALERADQVRLALSSALRAQRPFAELEPLVSELIDLVPLALAE